MIVGEIHQVVIEKLTQGGDSIARVPDPNTSGDKKDFVIFVPYAARGETLRVRLTEVKKQFARAEIVAVVKPSAERVEPACPHYFAIGAKTWCGGCNLQHLNYPAQLRNKKTALTETLQKIGGFAQISVDDPLGSADDAWQYRNKIQVPLRNGKHGPEAGFFAPGSHAIVPLQNCLIQPTQMLDFVHFVLAQMQQWKLTAYDSQRARGWLRHIYLRRQMQSGKMVAAFVTNGEFFPMQKQWRQLIQSKFPTIIGLHQNINLAKTNVILGPKWRNIFGYDSVLEKLPNLKTQDTELLLKVSIGSFFQVNTKMAQQLYATVKKMAGRNPKTVLLDLYCGVGGIGLACAENFDHVLGVDLEGSSIQDGRENIRLNKIFNVKFYTQSAEDFMQDFATQKQDCIVTLDPPRAGCQSSVLQKILQLMPRKIIYVSCEPSTLARDLKILCADKKYSIKQVQPVDLFAQSAHLETVVLLERE